MTYVSNFPFPVSHIARIELTFKVKLIHMMQILLQNREIAAACFARLLLGFLFFFQGWDAVFKVKIKNVVAAYETSFSSKGIPRILTVVGSWFTSYTELICGFLLILGLFEIPALYILGINILLASIAFGITTPMWDMRYVFPRVILLLFLLIIPRSWDILSLDNFLFQH
ncbi:MAG: hypothetical protein JWO32_1718 [Bacteroidetes bacterium]|nr:hypothetical protein [Bacteroidota bacterium]